MLEKGKLCCRQDWFIWGLILFWNPTLLWQGLQVTLRFYISVWLFRCHFGTISHWTYWVTKIDDSLPQQFSLEHNGLINKPLFLKTILKVFHLSRLYRITLLAKLHSLKHSRNSQHVGSEHWHRWTCTRNCLPCTNTISSAHALHRHPSCTFEWNCRKHVMCCATIYMYIRKSWWCERRQLKGITIGQ